MKLLTILANAIVAASLAALLFSCDKSSQKTNSGSEQPLAETSGKVTSTISGGLTEVMNVSEENQASGNEQGNLPANTPTITIGQVLEDYLKNASKAQAKYQGKRLRLSGRVLWCNPQPNGKIKVVVIDLQEELESELMLGRSVAIFDASAMKGLRRGQARFNTEGLALMTEENKDNFQITFDGTITDGKIEEAGEDDELPSLPEIKIADCILVPEVPSLNKTESKVKPYTPKIIYDIGRFPAPKPVNDLLELALGNVSESGRLLDPNVKHVKESGFLALYDRKSLDITVASMAITLNMLNGFIKDNSATLFNRVCTFNLRVVIIELFELYPELGKPKDKEKEDTQWLLQDIKARASRGDSWK